MVKKSAGAMSISTQGKPTEHTGVPQPPHQGGKHGVMDGIVRGVARHTYTPMVDGLVKSACSHKATDGVHGVKAPATKMGLQQFGSVPYADGKVGR